MCPRGKPGATITNFKRSRREGAHAPTFGITHSSRVEQDHPQDVDRGDDQNAPNPGVLALALQPPLAPSLPPVLSGVSWWGASQALGLVEEESQDPEWEVVAG